MKTLLRVALLLLFAVNVNAQTFNVNLAGVVTPAGSGVTVVVTNAGTVSNTTYCTVSPFWIGTGGTGIAPLPGSYTFTFSRPVRGFETLHSGMDNFGGDTEKVRFDVNGIFYPINVSHFTPYLTTCNQCPATINGGWLFANTGLACGAGNGGRVTVRACDINSVTVYTNGVMNGNVFSFSFDTGNCFHVVLDTPCEGEPLTLYAVGDGDTTGASFVWTGPGSFTSSVAFPVLPSVSYADTGVYRVIRTLGIVLDTAYARVSIHPKPVATATYNSPLCGDNTDTLRLSAGPSGIGYTYLWSGPGSFSSTAQFPTRIPFSDADTGIYKVIVTTNYGCQDSITIDVDMLPSPPRDTISGVTQYCQGATPVPFTVRGTPGSTIYWYSATNPYPAGPGSTIMPSVSTSTPGFYKFWSTQTLGGCFSPPDSIIVKIVPTPLAPGVTGTNQYCQFLSSLYVPHSVTLPTSSAVARWYTSPTGGSPLSTQPVPNFNVPGTYNSYVSIIDSGCEGPRTLVAITINPKPPKPVVTPQDYCQFKTPSQVIGVPANAGDVLTWYGPGVTGGMAVAPTPNTSFAPDTIRYYVTETNAFGCISDSTMLPIVIKLKPDPPLTRPVQYCQKDVATLLNAQVDSDGISHLNWYYNTILLPGTPTPFTDTVPGTYAWWVSQTVPNSAAGCISDSTPVIVTILGKPQFSIEASSPWVCQFDSLRFAYKGATLFQPGYTWTLPVGAGYADGADQGDSTITLKFDSVNQDNFIVKLRATNYNGFCFADTSIKVKVVPQPTMVAGTKPDVCMLDTVRLALESRSDNANSYTWFIDNTLMPNSKALNIVSGNSHTGGPFLVSWNDTGLHIIEVRSATVEGCKSEPTFDSVLVHGVPDASFTYKLMEEKSKFCIDDSVYFTANVKKYNNSYTWAPAHAFNNNNSPEIWGLAEEAKSTITLTVTDPYGCYSTQSLVLNPEYCCSLAIPNAFTPNGDLKNDVFKPYHAGYHRYHMFRIVNRWGQTIFESANSTDAVWDGNYNGVPQDMGVYYYYIKFDCGGGSVEQKGDVTLIR